MILKKFVARQIHGYLNFDISFNERLSLMTGINGSGKTTILNCIQALLTSNLSILQSINYEQIELYLDSDAKSGLVLIAKQLENRIEIRASNTEEIFSYSKYVPDPTLPTYRQIEGEVEHFRDLMATSTNHPVMKAIDSIPAPMFLGLDRRAKLAADDRRPGAMYRPRTNAARRPSRGMLGTSVNEAEEIAVDAYRDAQLSAGNVSDQLQRQLILNLLTPSDGFGALTLPTTEDKHEIERVRNDLALFPAIFRLPPKEVSGIVEPFLDKIADLVAKLPLDEEASKFIDQKAREPDRISDIITWSNSKEQLKRIAVISRMVSSYNERRAKALEPFEKYKKLVNDFLLDSGKSIDIDQSRRGIQVSIQGVKDGKDLSALSSGEAQIFVILTNLAFGAASKGENIFIIDEPELSLHVRWQEMFVDSVLAANRSTQFIMATHSPSIILERLSDCIDVVGTKGRSRRA